MGREDPIEFDILYIYIFCLVFVVEWDWIVLLGNLTPLCFCIFIYICFEPYIYYNTVIERDLISRQIGVIIRSTLY
jgi:hypothetical protein